MVLNMFLKELCQWRRLYYIHCYDKSFLGQCFSAWIDLNTGMSVSTRTEFQLLEKGSDLRLRY